MKKLFKTMAAISAMAVLSFPANLTVSAIDIRKDYPYNPIINESTYPGAGFTWGGLEQVENPVLFKDYLESKGKFTYYATVTDGREYGAGALFAILHRDIAESSRIQQAKSYVDNISVKSSKPNYGYYAVCMEYENYSKLDTSRVKPNVTVNYNYFDYALRTLSGPYLTSVLDLFYTSDLSDLNYDYFKTHNSYTGYLYLDNHYIAGLKVTSSDPYTTFDTPVLEPRAKSGFRTKITFHIRKPEIDKTVLFGSSTVSTSGSKNFDVLTGLKITCNGSGTNSYGIDNYSNLGKISKKTISIPKSEFYERNDRYQGLISAYSYPDDFLREVSGSEKEYFNQNNFVGAKRSGNNVYIYIGKKYNTMIGDPDWRNGTSYTKFNGFFRCGGRDILGHCRWLRTQLDSASYVYFYSDATPNSHPSSSFYSCSASTLLSRLNNG